MEMKDTIRVNLPGVRMIAHRGVSGLERENTCAAFVAAGNRSYGGVETDVHKTADGQYIIVHDDDLLRIAGLDWIIEETDYDRLRGVRLTDTDGCMRSDLGLPSLKEYLNICKKYEKDCVLELKNHFEPADIDGVLDVIRASGWLERTTLISFDLPNLICVRKRLPEQCAQYLVEKIDDGVIDTLKAYKLDLDAEYMAVTREWVKVCHEAGIRVNVWTVDDPEDARRLAEYGVDDITSNILE